MIRLNGTFIVDPLGVSKAERIASNIPPADYALLLAELQSAGLTSATLDEKLDYLNTPREYASDEPETRFASPDTMVELSGILASRAFALPDNHPAKLQATSFSGHAVTRALTLRKNADREAPETQALREAAIALGLMTELEFTGTFTIPPDGWVQTYLQTPASHVLGTSCVVQKADLE